MKIAVVQMNSGTDVPANVAKACDFVARAAAQGAGLVVLPEFFNTLYFAQYWDTAWTRLAEPESGPSITAVREAARRHKVHVIATIYEDAGAGVYFDTAFHLDPDGRTRFKFRKIHPAGVKSLEKLFFRYGSRLDTYAWDTWRVGIGICYDMGFPETARTLTVNGAELLIAPYATQRREMFQEMLRVRAFENGAYLAAANKVGIEGNWDLGGQSLIADPTGRILASANDKEEALLVAEIDRARVVEQRARWPVLRDRRPDLYGPLTAETEDVLDAQGRA
jgi:N-carbamoylputrescine amidase